MLAPLGDAALKRRFPKRCTLTVAGPMRFSVTGPEVTSERPTPFLHEVVVVEENEDQLRIATGDSNVRLVVFVSRDQARVATIEQVSLTPSPGDAADPLVSVRVDGGVALEPLQPHDNPERVHFFADGVEVFGWIAPDKLGETFTPTAKPKATDVDGEVAYGSTATNGKGETVARFFAPAALTGGHFGPFEVKLLPGGPKGMQAILWYGAQVEVRGFVPQGLVHRGRRRAPELQSSIDVEQSGSVTDLEEVRLERGAALFSSDGLRIGVVLHEMPGFVTSAGDRKDDLRYVELFVEPYGFLELYVRGSQMLAK